MLQGMFEEAIQEHAGSIVADLLESKLGDEGVVLTRRQRAKLLRTLVEGQSEELRFRSWRFWDRRNVSVEITGEDLRVLEAEMEEMTEELPDRVISFVTAVSPNIGHHIKKQYRKELRRDRRQILGFRSRLYRTWRDGLHLLDLIVELATRIGQEAGSRALEGHDSTEVLPSVLIRLHGRGIRVCREILVLLEAGYPEAAMTRWRALHELTVIALLIREHGEQCAVDYVEHDVVQEFKVAKRYQEAAPVLGYAPLSADEIESLRESAERAAGARGRHFWKDYGWAFEYLQGQPCTFAGLEKAVAMSHLRPFYSRASQGHARRGSRLLSVAIIGQPRHSLDRSEQRRLGGSWPQHGAELWPSHDDLHDSCAHC